MNKIDQFTNDLKQIKSQYEADSKTFISKVLSISIICCIGFMVALTLLNKLTEDKNIKQFEKNQTKKRKKRNSLMSEKLIPSIESVDISPNMKTAKFRKSLKNENIEMNTLANSSYTGSPSFSAKIRQLFTKNRGF